MLLEHRGENADQRLLTAGNNISWGLEDNAELKPTR
jgi:hypothetical protein